jgi:hypothetical protein
LRISALFVCNTDFTCVLLQCFCLSRQLPDTLRTVCNFLYGCCLPCCKSEQRRARWLAMCSACFTHKCLTPSSIELNDCAYAPCACVCVVCRKRPGRRGWEECSCTCSSLVKAFQRDLAFGLGTFPASWLQADS